MEKQCTLCKRSLHLGNFNKKKSNKDGLQNVCRDCNRKRSRKYYSENRKKHLGVIAANREKHRSRNREFVLSIKQQFGCALCDETEPCCLDFHHLHEDKKEFGLHDINKMTPSLMRIKEEVQKCVCVCSNCHRKIHAGLLEVDESHLCVL